MSYYYLLLGNAILFEVAGTLMLKASGGFEKWSWGLAALASYVVSLVLMSLCLRVMSVGIVYAIWTGVGVTLVCLASFLLWHQQLDPVALTGIALVVLGVGLITLKSGAVFQ